MEVPIDGFSDNIRSSKTMGYHPSPRHGSLLHRAHPRRHPSRLHVANPEGRQKARRREESEKAWLSVWAVSWKWLKRNGGVVNLEEDEK